MDFHDHREPERDDAPAPVTAVDRPPRHLVVIGNGMAGCRAVEELIARDADRYRVTIFGAEPHVNYNRIMLSPVLAGEKTFEEIVINGHDWYADNVLCREAAAGFGQQISMRRQPSARHAI